MENLALAQPRLVLNNNLENDDQFEERIKQELTAAIARMPQQGDEFTAKVDHALLIVEQEYKNNIKGNRVLSFLQQCGFFGVLRRMQLFEGESRYEEWQLFGVTALGHIEGH